MKLFAKVQYLIHWTAYESPIAGKSPRMVYQSAISKVQTLATCMALMSSSSRNIDLSFPSSEYGQYEAKYAGAKEQWIHKLTKRY